MSNSPAANEVRAAFSQNTPPRSPERIAPTMVAQDGAIPTQQQQQQEAKTSPREAKTSNNHPNQAASPMRQTQSLDGASPQLLLKTKSASSASQEGHESTATPTLEGVVSGGVAVGEEVEALSESTGGGDVRLRVFRGLFDCSELYAAAYGQQLSPRAQEEMPTPHIDAYLLPRTDAHQSEYLAERDERVHYLSGFSGSNAHVVVTREEARLWTDSRYSLQAGQELHPGWTLMTENLPETEDPLSWVIGNVAAGSVVGFDPHLFGLVKGRELVEKLSAYGLHPLALSSQRNLVDVLWESDSVSPRPPEPLVKCRHLAVETCGESCTSKITRLRERLNSRKCDSIVLTLLDDIAWLLNIRGADIPYNPVVFAVAAITAQNAFLFIDERKLTTEVSNHLEASEVKVFPYASAAEFVAKYHAKCLKKFPRSHRIWLPPTTNYALGSLVHDAKYNALEEASPVQAMKCMKNKVELAGMRNAHVRDSAAHVQFLLWLRRELELGHLVDERRAAKQMDYYRSQLPNYVSPSFETISAAEENSALPHYPGGGQHPIHRATHYLIDSGGQYLDGTTDVTRTVCHADGEALAHLEEHRHFRRMFTLVLMGHIDCASVRFPAGIAGMRLDALARLPLWREGCDFGHGVGHGVGHFLNVHEGPIGIMARRGVETGEGGLHQGQVITIEPGYYAEGKWGIRIENCYEIVAAPPGGQQPTSGGAEEVKDSGADKQQPQYLTFTPLTYVPIQKNLVERSLLEERHIAWLNNYHNRCLELVGKYLQEQGMQEEYNFLAEACTPL